MGYTTDFQGSFKLNKQLTLDLFLLLKGLGEGYEHSTEDGKPDAYCQWVPTKDGHGIEWNHGEKFYLYEEWLQWIIDRILKPNGYKILEDSVAFRGEDIKDCGEIYVEAGVVRNSKTTPRIGGITEIEQISNVMDLISKYGSIDGAHHKQWLIDQIARVLLQDDYTGWASGDEETGEQSWDEGIAP